MKLFVNADEKYVKSYTIWTKTDTTASKAIAYHDAACKEAVTADELNEMLKTAPVFVANNTAKTLSAILGLDNSNVAASGYSVATVFGSTANTSVYTVEVLG